MVDHLRSERFHTSAAALAGRFAGEARQDAFRGTSAAHLRAWQSRARRRLATLLGLHRFTRCPPRARRVRSERREGLTHESWIMQTERGVWMPFTLIVPERSSPATPRPLVLCPHGHGSGGKWATSGRSDLPGMAETIARYHYDYGVQIARAGCMTACPDARGFGERREPARQGPADLLGGSCHELLLAGAPLGLTVQGMWTWDLMRLVDLLVRDRRVDRSAIGCAGLSGGGLQTLDLAALDVRVRAAVVSGYFYGVQQSLQVLNGNCMCNLVPDLWRWFDLGDIGAMIAPRALCIETGDADGLNGAGGLRNVRSQVAIARRAFRAAGSEDHLAHHVFPGSHRWDGVASVPWLVAQLGADR